MCFIVPLKQKTATDWYFVPDPTGGTYGSPDPLAGWRTGKPPPSQRLSRYCYFDVTLCLQMCAPVFLSFYGSAKTEYIIFSITV